MVAVDIERVFALRNICRDCVSHPRFVVFGLRVLVTVDHHDDLVCLGEPWLDMVVVRGRNHDGSYDNLHVRLVREEAHRSLTSRRGLKRLG